MNLREKLTNIIRCYRQIDSWLISIIGALVLSYIFNRYTSFDLITGNIGRTYAITTISLQYMISVLFGANIALLWNKLKVMNKINRKEFGGTTAGSLMGLLVIGCPTCNMTLASFVGLGSFVSVLPFAGLELKIASLALLLYSINSLAKSANICEVK